MKNKTADTASFTQSLEAIIRKEIIDLPSYNAGLPEEYVKKHYGVKTIARLASNENPFGVSDIVKASAVSAATTLGRYSDPDSLLLRRALSKKLGVGHDRIIIGNGSEDLICIISRACLSSGERVVTVHPPFLLHEIYPKEQGAEMITVSMTDNLHFDVEAILAALKGGCRMLIFSNPSNPVGAMVTEKEFARICKAAAPETIMVIDEAYYEYAAGNPEYPDSLKELEKSSCPYVILRTFSKAYGLAGARVGYGITSSPGFAEQLNKLRTPFNVNSIAQKAALSALHDDQHIERTVEHNHIELKRVNHALNTLGFLTAPSYGNFIFFNCGRNSLEIAEELLRAGIIVKPWSAKGYERFIRVTIGTKKDNDMFLKAITGFRQLPGTI